MDSLVVLESLGEPQERLVAHEGLQDIIQLPLEIIPLLCLQLHRFAQPAAVGLV